MCHMGIQPTPPTAIGSVCVSAGAPDLGHKKGNRVGVVELIESDVMNSYPDSKGRFCRSSLGQIGNLRFWVGSYRHCDFSP